MAGASVAALLLADEPTAHLDQLVGRGVIRLLEDAPTHDADVVAAATHVLDLGRAQDS